MSINKIQQALPGERVVALSPEDATSAATDWLRRPNLFSGRALTASALDQRQRWQAGRIAQRGQAFTAGVVRGMEVSHPLARDGSDMSPLRVFVEPGLGLGVSGEDVVIVRRAQFLLSNLPVVAPPSVFAGLLDADAQQAAEESAVASADPTPGAPLPRAIGPTLGEILAHASDRLPLVGILVLQPVTVDTADLDRNDPCDRCPCDDGATGSDPASFEDWRKADGVRLLWYAWPEEWRPLPFTRLRQRNALAHTIFEAEAALLDGECLPWEQYGVPVALITLSDTQHIGYIDRAAVVRQGGRGRESRLQRAGGSVAALTAGSRLPGLWQARIEQFAAQLAGMGTPLPAADVLADPFLHLPPCGLLPTSALRLDNLQDFRSDFFPPLFTLDAAPVPLEQLDLAIREAAPMAALDLGLPERVRLLVPVSQASWEPRLLLKDVIDPAFDKTLKRFLLDRARALGSRQGLRGKAALLAHALDGQQHVITDFDKDPLAVEPEVLSPWGPPPKGGGHRSSLQAGLHQHFFDGASTKFHVATGDSLFIWVYLDPVNPPRTLMLQWHTAGKGWEQRAYFGENLIEFGTADSPSRFHVGDLPDAGAWTLLKVAAAALGLEGADLDGMAFSLFDGRAAFGETGALAGTVQRNWFSNFIPPDARVQGNEPWDLLTHNDLWSPFERDDGVVPSLPETEITGGGDLLGAAGQAALAIPKSGFSIYYPLDSAWRGHVISFIANPGTAPVFPQKAGSDALSTWVYLDELTPPRAIWAWMMCVGLDAGNNPAGGSVLRLAFWGENRLAELNAFVPGMKNFEAQTLRAGALPQAGVWTRLTLPQPDGSAMAGGATKLRVIAVVFMTFGGSIAFSDVSIETAAIGDASIPVWPLGTGADGKPTPPYVPYKSSQPQLQTALDVLTPTPSSHIGTVRTYTELVNDPMLARLSFHERSQLQLRGLAAFADYLRVRIDRADDITDFGFAHMQVDLYRIRQMMLSTTDATRIAISPALAAIAKSDSAITVQAQIKDYLAGVKAKPPASKAMGAAIGASAAATAAAAATPRSAGTSTAGSGLTAAQTVQISAQAALIKAPRAPLNIVYSRPVIGLSEVRTTAIAERLRQPPSTEARDYALANRQQTVSSLLDLLNAFMAEDSGEVPALFQDFDIFGLEGDPFLEGNAQKKRKLADFRANTNLLTLVLQPPPLGAAVDEGSLFTQTAALSDNTVAILRQLEGRLAIYRDALSRCERAQAELQTSIDAVSQRLQQVEHDLAEARHDVGVARALTAEEQARIDAVNARRRKVLDDEVKFLAYVRPREASNVVASVPRRVVDPALAEAPVPACLRDHHDVPDELEDMLKTVREAPAIWFMRVPKLLDKLDRSDLLLRAVKSAQQRMPMVTARKPVAAPVPGKVGNAVAQMLTRQNTLLAPRVQAVSKVNLVQLAAASWQNLRNQAQEIVSLGDLIDGAHGKSAVANEAADEFNRISSVCSCLHAEFCGVPALIRLGWAETLSEFDDAPNLRNLGSLQRWAEVDSTDRRQMQAYVDWLFAQVEPKQPQGEALINDVVRMCLLLASHAPVGRIIVGHLPRPITAVRPGIRIPLQAQDPSRLRVGMQALLYRAGKVVARALVEDVGHGEVSARVLHTSAAQIDLDLDVRVHFDHAGVVSAAPARAGGIFKR